MLINSVGGGGGDEKKPIFCDGGAYVGQGNWLASATWSDVSYKPGVVGWVTSYGMLLNAYPEYEHLYFFGFLAGCKCFVAGVDLLNTPVTLTFDFQGEKVKEKFWLDKTANGTKFDYTLKGEILETEHTGTGSWRTGAGKCELLPSLDTSFEVDY